MIVAVIRCLAFGFLFSDKIDDMLGKCVDGSISLVVSGILLLFVDDWFQKSDSNFRKRSGIRQAIIIGAWQNAWL